MPVQPLRVLGPRHTFAAVLACLTLLSAAGCGDDEDPVDAGVEEAVEGGGPVEDPVFEAIEAELDELNDSGATGSTSIELNDDGTMTVIVEAADVADGLPHAQHIHIGGTNTCPPEDVAGEDGFLTVPEGEPIYGPIKISLTTKGDVGADSALAVKRFPEAGKDGTLAYNRTFELPEGVTAEMVRAGGVLVMHGMSDTELGKKAEKYDGPRSELSKKVPKEAALPILCAPLTVVDEGA